MTFAILERDTRSALLFLEEHFTCPLCCETIAHPVSVTSSCGHVFCTICILRWLFSLVHEVCGGWHTNVGCPICRETLSLPPYDPPRSLFTLPIVFNRTAARILDEVIEKLEVNAMAVLDTKDSCVTQLRNDSCSIVSTSTSHFTKELVKWSKSGSSHKDWTQRCLEGKTELDDLIENWKDMAWTDFQAMKRKLEV
ncbi:hypothetical protein DL96DRAFT_1583014 [Flagelloscypha sp. PMI_526]|nr:hypothetical protein DL96DRAFT_1583014 [Flagelloscypha sp. PMI_526]